MKILHLLPYISESGAFGGPATVALDQAMSLSHRGHSVTLMAGAPPSQRGLSHRGGLSVKKLPAVQLVPPLGFGTLFSPTFPAVLREARRHDVIHLHLARDAFLWPLALPLTKITPTVVQTHGMILPRATFPLEQLDRKFTIPALQQARRVFCLTRDEATALEELGGMNLPIELLHNGVVSTGAPNAADDIDLPSEVLFLARINKRKRPDAFIRMARRLIAQGTAAKFTLVGPDDGEGPSVRQDLSTIGHPDIAWEGAVAPDSVRERMARATIYVLPARDEPFGLTIVEAMSVGLPVVVTRSCALAEQVTQHGAGLVVDDDDESDLARAVSRLLNDPDLRRQMGRQGRRLVGERFKMDAVVERLEETYLSVLD